MNEYIEDEGLRIRHEAAVKIAASLDHAERYQLLEAVVWPESKELVNVTEEVDTWES